MASLRKDEPLPSDPNMFNGAPPHLKDHPLFGKGTVGLITADAPRFPVMGHGGNHALSFDLKKLGLNHQPTHGSYGGGKENSFIVHNPTREQMQQLGHKYGQEAVVFGENGHHQMI